MKLILRNLLQFNYNYTSPISEYSVWATLSKQICTGLSHFVSTKITPHETEALDVFFPM